MTTLGLYLVGLSIPLLLVVGLLVGIMDRGWRGRTLWSIGGCCAVFGLGMLLIVTSGSGLNEQGYSGLVLCALAVGFLALTGVVAGLAWVLRWMRVRIAKRWRSEPVSAVDSGWRMGYGDIPKEQVEERGTDVAPQVTAEKRRSAQ